MRRIDSTVACKSDLSLDGEWPSGLLSTYTGVQLLGIVQKALTNVRKSSGASRVRVVVCSNDADVSILVEDNGCGFDSGMEQRAGITDSGS